MSWWRALQLHASCNDPWWQLAWLHGRRKKETKSEERDMDMDCVVHSILVWCVGSVILLVEQPTVRGSAIIFLVSVSSESIGSIWWLEVSRSILKRGRVEERNREDFLLLTSQKMSIKIFSRSRKMRVTEKRGAKWLKWPPSDSRSTSIESSWIESRNSRLHGVILLTKERIKGWVTREGDERNLICVDHFPISYQRQAVPW